jgi:protein gp37
VPAVVHFLSVEPLLEAIDLRFDDDHAAGCAKRSIVADLEPCTCGRERHSVGWVITGGESGPKFRTMDHACTRSIRDQCVAGGVAYYQKQSSGLLTGTGPWLEELDGSRWTWHQFPITPFNPAGTFTPPQRVP